MKSYETSFLEMMGDNPRNRVLDFLIENRRVSWQYKEIIDSQEIGYSTLKKIIPELSRLGLVMIEEVIGRNKMVRINMKNPVVKELVRLQLTISDYMIHTVLDAEDVKDGEKE